MLCCRPLVPLARLALVALCASIAVPSALAVQDAAPSDGAGAAPSPARQDPVAFDESALAAARAAAAKGDHEAAHAALVELLRAAPDDARVLSALAAAESALALHDDAVMHLARAYGITKDATTQLALAQALYAQALAKTAEGELQAADFAFLDARRFFGEAGDALQNAEAWWGAGQVALARFDDDDALHCFGRALNVDPKHVPSLLGLGGVRYRRAAAAAGDPIATREERRLGEEAYRAILAIDPRDALGANGMGWFAKQAGERDQAIEWFHASLKADPSSADSFANLCELLSESKEDKQRLVKLLDAVVDGARKTAKTDAGKLALATAFYYRGKAKALGREFEAAKKDFAEATRLEPDFKVDCELQVVKGQLAAGERDAAAKHLLALAKSDGELLVRCIQGDAKVGELATAISSLADDRYQANGFDDARELFRLAASGLGNHAGLWNNYALLARDTGKFEDAYAAYETALGLDPSNPALLNDTAVVLHYNLRRDLDRARELYEQAIVEAKRVLDDANVDSFGKDSAAIALRDATNNLRRLAAGQHEEEPPARAGG